MRRIFIVLLGFFMLPASTGVHVDFAFCDGVLAHIDFFHQDVEEDCCKDTCCDTKPDCCSEEEVILEASIDVLSLNQSTNLEFQQSSATIIVLPYNLGTHELDPTFLTLFESVPIPQEYRQSPSFLQVFRC
jgi:hypothetical protein